MSNLDKRRDYNYDNDDDARPSLCEIGHGCLQTIKVVCLKMTSQANQGSEIPPSCRTHVFGFFCCSASFPRLTHVFF